MSTRSTLGAVAALALCLWFAPSASADYVELHDGRVFRGEIIENNPDEGVRIDTVVQGIRTQLFFSNDEIAVATQGELAPGFFGKPEAQPRLSDATGFAADATLYLEVPLIGRFGREIRADSIAEVLRYAERHRVPHVVFVMDTPGGDLDEAARIYRLLEEYDAALTYHAVVRRCRGDAMAVAVRCDSLAVVPGAVIGGADGEGATDDPEDSEVGAIVRAQVAYELGAQADRRFRAGPMVRAMIDPSETYAVWRDEDGVIVEGSAAPEGIDEGRVLAEAPAGVLLALDFETARELEVPVLERSVADLGGMLGYDDWTRESDFGSRAVRLATDADESSVQAEFELEVRDNIGARESALRYIEQNIAAAAETDPSKGSYQEYSNHFNWSWGRGGYTRYDGDGSARSGSYSRRYGDAQKRRRAQRQPNEFTAESLRQWRNRTDLALQYLGNAKKAVDVMIDLEERARELGLDPMIEIGDLAWMRDDCQAKINYLKRERNRRGR